MRAMRWVGWPIFILFVSFLIGLFIYDGQMEEGSMKAKESEISSALLIGKKSVDDFPNISIHYEYNLASNDEIKVEWPEFKSKSINKKVAQWMEDQQTNGKRNISVNANKMNEHFFQFILTATDNQSAELLPFIVRIKDEDLVQLTDLFSVNDNFKEQLVTSINKQIVENKLDSKIDKETVSKMTTELDGLFWSFDQESFTVYLPDGNISTDLSDARIDIPLQQLLPYATDDFISQHTLLAGIVAEEQARKKEAERKRREEEERKRREMEQKKQEQQPVDENFKYIAFTFDDGPHPDVTPQILATLKQYGAKGTFFMLGSEVNKYPNIVKQVADEGHELANHSHNHPDLTKVDYGTIESQLYGTRDMIEQVTGIKTSLIRPPYGALNDSVMSVAGASGGSIVLWSVDSRDWESRNADAIYNMVMRDVQGGSIILMHDLYPSTAAALPRLLETLKNQGYEFVTVSDLLQRLGKNGTGPHHGV